LVKYLLQQRASRVFVVPAYTCFSVPQSIEQAGGTCVYVDVDKTLDFDLSDLAEQLKPVDPCDVVLLATSLFGAPIRDYKHMLPSAVVIEDRSQSVYDPGLRSDYQILSFGPGKLLSLGGGGAVVGRDPLKWNMDPGHASRLGVYPSCACAH
jgi:dTDP-4-amino-4,6-dideoxygalactose transaminase